MSDFKFPLLETDRLILRQIESNDRQDLYEIFSSDETMKYYGMFPYEKM